MDLEKGLMKSRKTLWRSHGLHGTKQVEKMFRT